MRIRVLITPLAKAAYFDAYLDVARAELETCGFTVGETGQAGTLDFLDVEATETDLTSLARMSTVQGLFVIEGPSLRPLDVGPEFHYPEALVYGQKYQGKTNETVTQLAINVGLKAIATGNKLITVFDPMAGRGTTLLWALRYGLSARGIDIDERAHELFHAHVKKQCKLNRIKHEAERGRLGDDKKEGAFSRFTFANETLTLVHGDSRLATGRQGKRFDLVVTDLPYGIQHKGDANRNPMSIVTACAPAWVEGLKPDGAIVLIFNNTQTKRADLIDLFSGLGLDAHDFAAPHRMSESIVRDLLVFQSGKERQ